MGKYLVFDLDDTLYKEEDFLLSAYAYIACEYQNYVGHNIYDEMVQYRKKGESTFDIILDKYEAPFTITDLLEMYRFHIPNLSLPESSRTILEYCKINKINCGVLTDGRSRSQRNKLSSLGITNYFDKIIISQEIGNEKPNKNNYLIFQEERPNDQFYYIGDNTSKDFVSANKLGWITICLKDDGRNIHKQDWTMAEEYLPHHIISEISEIVDIMNIVEH